jgi:hypothetical protein
MTSADKLPIQQFLKPWNVRGFNGLGFKRLRVFKCLGFSRLKGFLSLEIGGLEGSQIHRKTCVYNIGQNGTALKLMAKLSPDQKSKRAVAKGTHYNAHGDSEANEP